MEKKRNHRRNNIKMFNIFEKIAKFLNKERSNQMKLSDISSLVSDLQIIEQDCEKFHIHVKARSKPDVLLQKIKALGYAAFLHADASGIQIVVTDRRKSD